MEETLTVGKCFGGGWRSFAVRRKMHGSIFQKFPPIFRKYPYTIQTKHVIVVKDCYKMWQIVIKRNIIVTKLRVEEQSLKKKRKKTGL